MRTVSPNILYFGTPVALISSWNEDGTTNLAPISSFWALGWTMTLGLLDETKTAENLARHAECVVNLPAPSMWKMVEKLAPLTGKDPVPELKAKQFRTEKDKFAASGFSRRDSEVVRPSRAAECPIQMEAEVLSLHISSSTPAYRCELLRARHSRRVKEAQAPLPVAVFEHRGFQP